MIQWWRACSIKCSTTREGRIISAYELDDVAPQRWTAEGLEEIAPIHWTGERTQLAAAKERHTRGDVRLFEPIGGRFVARMAARPGAVLIAAMVSIIDRD